MAEIEPPSFSLDLDLEFEPDPPCKNNSGSIEPQQQIGKVKVDDFDESKLRVSDSESSENSSLTRFRFRRLRRGGTSFSTPISKSIDDDIEDFSDEDITRKNVLVAPQHHSSCSSSKLPLSGCGILTRLQESTRRVKQDSSCPSTSLGSSKGKTVSLDLTASPLRRFQLLDSESDPDDPSDVNINKEASCAVSSKSNKQEDYDIQARFKLIDSGSVPNDPSDVHINKEANGVDSSKNNNQEDYDIQAQFKLLDSESDPDDPSNEHIDRAASGVNLSKNNNKKEYNIRARFKLLDSDSDSDDPSDGEFIDGESSGVDFLKNFKQKETNHGSHKMSLEKSKDLLPPISQKQDLWKDFCVSDKHSVLTPAFDEFCKEYKASKPAPVSHKLCSSEQKISMNNANTLLQHQDPGSVPPSHRFFFHNDLKIQRLVRSRLPHFCPLTSADAGSNLHNASSIDYMSQFGQGDCNRQTGKQVTTEKSSRRVRKKSNMEGAAFGSGDWVNPRQAANIPKDAGRRRVHADGQSAGQWLHAENGKKVYVTKDGKELTGKLAYIRYRKESGKGFKKVKKKSVGKKKKVKNE